MVCLYQWSPSAWDTLRSGRRRTFTRTRSAARTMTRRDVGTIFSDVELRPAFKARSNNRLPTSADFGHYWELCSSRHYLSIAGTSTARTSEVQDVIRLGRERQKRGGIAFSIADGSIKCCCRSLSHMRLAALSRSK